MLSHLILSLSFSGVDMGPLEKLAYQGLVDITPDAAVRAVVAALNKHSGRLTIIFDDYHRAGSPSTDRVFESLLELLPERAHIAIATRSKPGFRYSALKINGLVQQLSADDLRFSTEEAREILPTSGSEQDIAALMQRTEGWAMALQMAPFPSARPGFARRRVKQAVRIRRRYRRLFCPAGLPGSAGQHPPRTQANVHR